LLATDNDQQSYSTTYANVSTHAVSADGGHYEHIM